MDFFTSGETRTMANAFEKRMPVTTFLRDMFFGSVLTSPTATIDMDFYKNRQIAAPFVADGVSSVNVSREGTQQRQYKPPMVAPSRILDLGLLEQRYTGENPYMPMTAQERAELILQRDYNELSDSITRTEEKMAAELLQTGKVVAKGYVDDKQSAAVINTIDYGFDNTITVSATDKWDATTPGNPMKTVDAATELVRKAGYDPTIMVVGAKAATAMLSNTDFVKTQFDISRANLGMIDPQITSVSGNGFTLIGMLKMYNVYIYRYDAYYYDMEAKAVKPYIQPDKMILGARDLGEMAYGAVTMIDEDTKQPQTYETTRASQMITNADGGIKKMIVRSRPIPKPFDVSAWAVASVTA